MEVYAIDIGNSFNSPFGTGLGFADLASVILSNALVVAGVILLFLLIFGGISFIMGAGSGNPDQAERGKKAVTSAVIGFVVIFAAYWIIAAVQVITGVKILKPF